MTGRAAQAEEAGAEHALARPGFRKPQLAMLYDVPPQGERWLHEIKHDECRVLAAVGSDGVRTYTRNGKDGHLRHPVFKDLRADKAAADTTLERPED